MADDALDPLCSEVQAFAHALTNEDIPGTPTERALVEVARAREFRAEHKRVCARCRHYVDPLDAKHTAHAWIGGIIGTAIGFALGLWRGDAGEWAFWGFFLGFVLRMLIKGFDIRIARE
jgi:hypothetical protein